MARRMEFVAVCAFPGRAEFRFHSPSFYVEQWADLDRVGVDAVREAWAAISPGQPPGVIDYLPGALVYVSSAE